MGKRDPAVDRTIKKARQREWLAEMVRRHPDRMSNLTNTKSVAKTSTLNKPARIHYGRREQAVMRSRAALVVRTHKAPRAAKPERY